MGYRDFYRIGWKVVVGRWDGILEKNVRMDVVYWNNKVCVGENCVVYEKFEMFKYFIMVFSLVIWIYMKEYFCFEFVYSLC